jgi:uncharacterized protein
MTRHALLGSVAVMLVCAAAFMHGAGSDVADAVMNGDTAAVQKLLLQKADVNAPQVDGATALHWAIYRDDVALVDQLLRAGANVSVANREGTTPLAMASLYGNTAMIDRLLKAGADAKQLGPNGETMVMLAARNGSSAAIKRLVAAGADVNAKESLRGTTALMWAAEQKHAAAVKALVELGADVSAKSASAGLPRNRTVGPINGAAVEAAAALRHAAAASGRTIQEQVAYNKANGLPVGGGPGFGAGQGAANVPPAGAAAARGTGAAAARGAGGAPARGTGAAPARGGAAARGRRPAGAADAAAGDNGGADAVDDIVAGLVGGGSGGLTPLVFAAREGDLESAKVLFDAGADVNEVTEYGWTPLLVATNNRNYKLGAYLLEHGANVNLANKGGWTPLYLATDNRNIEGGDYPVPKPDMDHMEYIKLLLAHGADVNARVRENTLQRTIFTNQWFLEPGATAFIRAGQSSDIELMKLLLEHGADPKATTDHKDNALTASAGIGWVDGVVYERSPKDNIEAVKMLLDLGLDPNWQNNDGRTALMGAAHKGRNEVVQMLVDHGAKLDTRDKGSRDTGNVESKIAGHTWEALDYADGLVRFGVQSAVEHRETAALIRKLMTERGLPVPPANRTVDSICVVEVC